MRGPARGRILTTLGMTRVWPICCLNPSRADLDRCVVNDNHWVSSMREGVLKDPQPSNHADGQPARTLVNQRHTAEHQLRHWGKIDGG
jgi:hypothetical protein